MLQYQQPIDIESIVSGKTLAAIYRQLKLAGKLEGCATAYEGEIRQHRDVIAFDGVSVQADKTITFRSPFDGVDGGGFGGNGYPDMVKRIMDAVHDDRLMAKVTERMAKKLMAHFPHDWEWFACKLALGADQKGDYMMAIIAVNDAGQKLRPETPSAFLADDELDRMMAEVAPENNQGATALQLLPEG